MILIRFEDGTEELRWEGSPCVLGETSIPPWTPNNVVDIPFDEYSRRWFVTDMDHLLNSEDGWASDASPIWHSRGEHCAFWRITGQDKTTKALVGEWQKGKAETYEEQIRRLEAERDAVLLHAKERLASVISVIGLNNNQPRAVFRDAPVELVRSRRALADMRLPDSIEDAKDIRNEALEALMRALTAEHVMPPYVMARDTQDCPRGSFLDVVPDLTDEVEEHRETRKKLVDSEKYADEMAEASERNHEAWAAEKERADRATQWGTRLATALQLTTRALSLAVAGVKDRMAEEFLTKTVTEAAEALGEAQPGMTLDIAGVCARLVNRPTLGELINARVWASLRRLRAEERLARIPKQEAGSPMSIDISRFGRDHWSTLAYIETRCVDHDGRPDRRQMRCCPVRHPGLAHLQDPASPTRLRDGTEVPFHDDWDCAHDLEAAGLIVEGGTGMHPLFRMTAEGTRIAGLLRTHKVKGGSFSDFDPGPVALSSLEIIRRRPVMYVGPLDDPSLPTRLLQEGLCLSVGHGTEGRSSAICIELGEGRAVLRDDGPGLPMHEVHGVRFAEILLTQLFACKEAKEETDKDICQLGVTVLVALSSSFVARTFSEGFEWTMSFAHGRALGPFTRGDATTLHGTELRFELDKTIVVGRTFDVDCLRRWTEKHFPGVQVTIAEESP